MIEVFVWSVVFVVSLFILVKASDYFTESAEEVGLYFGLSPFIVGVTIVAMGTSLPELVSSLIAVFADSSEIVAGNVIGSNITNIFLILGVAAILAKKMKIDFDILSIDLPFFAGSAFYLALTCFDGLFTFTEAIVGLLLLVVYTLYTVKNKDHSFSIMKPNLEKRTIIILFISAFFIFLGAKYTIDAVIMISGFLSIPKEIIALSAVALGTSLPELMVTISAAKKGKPEIAVGNVLGSNIFNVFAVMGIPALFSALVIPTSIIYFSLPMMIVGTLMFYFITQDKKVTVWEGWLLVIFYGFFLLKLF